MRHAGFAVVASVTEATLNGMLQQGFEAGGPHYFPLPQEVTVGGTKVSLGGIAMLAPPLVELRSVGSKTHFAFFSMLNARVGASPAQRWRVRLDVSVAAQFLLAPVNNFVTLQLNTSSVLFDPFSVTFLQGPPPPQSVIDALQSQAVANAASHAVQMLPNLQLAQLCPATFMHSESYSFPATNFSEFDWFTIAFSVSKVVVRYFEGAVTIAADFAGVTNGDASALVDLTAQQTHRIYTHVLTDKAIEQGAPPFVQASQSTRYPGLTVLVNMRVIANVMKQISDQTTGTPMADHVSLISISAGYANFEKPLRGPEDGLHVGVKVRVYDSMAVNLLTFLENEASAHVYLQPFLQVYDGWKTEYQGNPRWRMYVARVDVETSFFLEVVKVVAEVVELFLFTLVSMPAMILNYQLFFKTLAEWNENFSKILAKANTDNAASKLQRQLQGDVYDADLPQDASLITVNEEGIETGWTGGRFLKSYSPVIPSGGATIRPFSWQATARQPIRTSVELDSAWQGLNRNDLKVTWEVRRVDTNEVIVIGIKPYNSPEGNGVSINHHSEQLYLVDEYRVRCTLTLIAGSSVGEIWSGVSTIKIEDKLDRRQSFVEWGPKWVRFRNAGTNHAMWSRLSRSRIHRTAVAARCRALKIATELGLGKGRTFHYFDHLPWGWDNVSQHRKELCDYCFFGGPDKIKPFPAYDWFEPSPGLAHHQSLVDKSTPGKEFFEQHFK